MMKNSEEKFFLLLLFFCCCEKRSLFLLCCFKTKVFCTRDFFFSLFLCLFEKTTQHLSDSLLTVKKRVRERDSERERGSSFVGSVPTRFRDQFLFLNSVSSISLLSRVLS